MKATSKTQLLNFLESRVEAHLQTAVTIFQNLTEDKLLQAAPNGGWSIAQCLEHLNTYGHYYLPEIKKGLAKPVTKHSETFTSSWLGNYFTQIMEPTTPTGKKKMKAFKKYIPPQALVAHAVIAEFIQQQETLLVYLKQAQSADLNAVKIPISLTNWIKLKLGDTLQFLIAHNERHLVQAKNLL